LKYIQDEDNLPISSIIQPELYIPKKLFDITSKKKAKFKL